MEKEEDRKEEKEVVGVDNEYEECAYVVYECEVYEYEVYEYEESVHGDNEHVLQTNHV